MLTCISGRGHRSCLETLRFKMIRFKRGEELLVVQLPVLDEWTGNIQSSPSPP